MKRAIKGGLLLMAALAAGILVTNAFAEDMAPMDHPMGGLGFRDKAAPIGGRLWVNQMVGIDAGFGFTNHKIPEGNGSDLTLNSFTLDVGVPICFAKWDRVHVIFRPGFEYLSDDDFFVDALTGEDVKFKINTYTVTGEIEGEVFLAKNASISASTGFGFLSSKPDLSGAESETVFGTFGQNATTLGFHLYLWGAK